MATIVVADDDADVVDAARVALTSYGYTVLGATDGPQAIAALGAADVDAVLADVVMPGMSGIDLCRHVVGNRPDVPVIVMTGSGNLDTAIAAIRAGAYDFIVKPLSMQALVFAVKRAVQHRQLLEQIRRLRRGENREVSRTLLGNSSAMRHVHDLVERLAGTEASALIVGASGTGKELVARALHENGRRRAAKFVSVNCAALPETLLESELFGHARGAFTDAKNAHEGLFAQANGGTLFLDEVGDMPLGLQPKLLRALQERVIRPVGGATEIPIDVRVVTATNKNLEVEVAQKRFRSDLYFRINVVQILLPPLRLRGNDVLLLAHHFLEKFALRDGKEIRGIGPAAAEKLLEYDWPGNVRELQNAMERAVALGKYDEIGVDDLPEKIRDHASSTTMTLATDDLDDLLTLRDVERRYIARVLAMTDGNKTLAAKLLGIDRKTLYRKLEVLEGGAVRDELDEDCARSE